MKPTATVIIPTTLNDLVLSAVDSVLNQDYGKVRALVVIDGYKDLDASVIPDRPGSMHPVWAQLKDLRNVDIVPLPYSTGKDGFYGHRVYAGFSHLVNSDYVFFLDQDNWYQPDHVSSLIEKMTTNKYSWAWSLRNIIAHGPGASSAIESCRDECESLGPNIPVWNSPANQPSYHLDTSSYAFHRPFLEKTGFMWHEGYAADRKFLHFLMTSTKARHGTSGKFTLNYRLDGNPNSVKMDFFTQGNAAYAAKYPDKPWIPKPKLVTLNFGA